MQQVVPVAGVGFCVTERLHTGIAPPLTMPLFLSCRSLLLLAPVLVAGCALNYQMADLPPGQAMVAYSKVPGDWPMGSPESREVLLIPANLQKDERALAAGLVVMNLISIPLTKVMFYPVSNNDPQAMHGIPVPFVNERSNLANPTPTHFLEDLQRSLNASIARDPKLVVQRFRNPVFVAGGRAALVELKGSNPAQFQMSLLLKVYRRADSGVSGGTHVVDCSGGKGQPRTLSQWSQGGTYLPVKNALNAALAECERLVVTQTKALMDVPTIYR